MHPGERVGRAHPPRRSGAGALEEHARHTEDRLAQLLARNIIVGDTTRRLLFGQMAKQWGEAVRPAYDSAWNAAPRLDVDQASI